MKTCVLISSRPGNPLMYSGHTWQNTLLYFVRVLVVNTEFFCAINMAKKKSWLSNLLVLVFVSISILSCFIQN